MIYVALTEAERDAVQGALRKSIQTERLIASNGDREALSLSALDMQSVASKLEGRAPKDRRTP